MKISTLFIFVLLCISCAEKKASTIDKPREAESQSILKSELQSIIDFADVQGAILIYDPKEDIYYSNDFKWANTGNLPASTFKITNTIIGLETGAIESENTVFKWDGEDKWLKNWEQDLVLKDAFQFSCVHCYQEVARKIGAEQMNSYIDKFKYGELSIDSMNIDEFWLRGESRISQMQQIDFLKRFYNQELSISESTYRIVKGIMSVEETDEYTLSGKSGLSNEGKYNGWFVGYIELKNNVYFYATNIEPKENFEINEFIKRRLTITKHALKELNLLR